MNVPVENVEHALATLWAEHADQGVVGHLRTVTFVAVCASPDDLPFAHGIVSRLLPVHPGRAVLAVLYDGGSASIDARVDLLQDTQRGVPCGEFVTLDVRGAAREWVPTAVERLLAPGARVFLWWIGDLPDHDTLFDRLAETASVVAFDSGVMDLRDLITLARLMEWSRGSYLVADLNWHHLRPWQELLARFFDDPVVTPRLADANELSIDFAPHRPGNMIEPCSPQAALYIGWFLSRLRMDPATAVWTRRSGTESEIVVPYQSRTLTIRMRAVERNDATPGSLLRVNLQTQDGARFIVSRDDNDPRVLGWEGECCDAVICPAVMRMGPRDDAGLLARQLDEPMRNVVFEASLRAAADLARLVATGHDGVGSA